jgi:hypothetical protein
MNRNHDVRGWRFELSGSRLRRRGVLRSARRRVAARTATVDVEQLEPRAVLAALSVPGGSVLGVFGSPITSPVNLAHLLGGRTPVLPRLSVPGVPSGVTGVPGNGEVHLSWTAPTSNGGIGVRDYVVQLSTDAGATWSRFTDGVSTATSATVTGLTNGTSYVFRVAAVNAAGIGPTSVATLALKPRTLPGVPTGVTGMPGNGRVRLMWTAPSSHGGAAISDYVVHVCSDAGATWSTFVDGVSKARSTTVRGLTNGTSYVFRVTAVNVAGTGTASAASVAVTPRTRPGVPTSVAGIPGDGQVSLTWAAPAADGGAAMSDYIVQFSSDAGSKWTTFADGVSTAKSATVTGLTNGTAYVFRVAAVNVAGPGAASIASAAIIPAAPVPPREPPTGVTVVSSTADAVMLSWNDVADESDYLIERSIDSATWTEVGRGSANATTFIDTGIDEHTEYSYRLIACNAGGRSAPSVVVTTQIGLRAPAGLTATVVNGGRIDLEWVDQSSRETHYVVEQFDASTNAWAAVSGVPVGSGGMVVTDAFAPNTTYHFRVRAVVSSWWWGTTNASSDDVMATVTTPAYPSPPVGLAVTASTDTTVTMSWTQASEEISYRIERSSDSATWNEVAHVAASTTTFTDTRLEEHSQYRYRVLASNAAGASAPSVVVTAQTSLHAPSGVAATVISGGRIDLAWTDRSSREMHYVVEQFEASTGVWAAVGGTHVGSSGMILTGPFAPNTTYQFRVRAVYWSWWWWVPANASSDDVTVSVTTPDYPSPPTGLKVASSTVDSVTLSWTDGAGETGYLVERSSDSGTWTEVGRAVADTTTFTDTALEEGSRYNYRIAAFNTPGASAASVIVNAHTRLHAPEGVLATAVDGGRIALQWRDHSSRETHYVVEQRDTSRTAWAAISGSPVGSSGMIVTGVFTPSTTYQFRVRAVALSWGWPATNTSSDSVTVSVTTPAYPSPPAGLEVVSSTNSSVTLSWKDAGAEGGYLIQRSSDSSTWTDISRESTTTTTFTDAGLAEASHYNYRVIAFNAAGASAPSLIVTARTRLHAPSGVVATVVNGGRIDLAWDDLSANEEYYVVEQYNPAANAWMAVGNTSIGSSGMIVLGSFVPNATYQFRVRAVAGSSWWGSWRVTSDDVLASVTTPAYPDVPGGLAATPFVDTVRLSWDFQADVWVVVERMTRGSEWMPVTEFMSATSSYEDADLDPRTAYFYRIAFRNTHGTSGFSRTVSAVTSAGPDVVAAYRSTSMIFVGWTCPFEAVTGIVIERTTSDGDTWSTITALAGNVTGYMDTSVILGTSYRYRILFERSARPQFIATSAETGPEPKDSDGDQLVDGEELAIGTNPLAFSTDRDMLGDGFERVNSLNPLDADEDRNGVSDQYDDFDGDGLANWQETVFGTSTSRADGDRDGRPDGADSDGDGISDGVEVTQGSDPKNSLDHGDEPNADERIKLRLSVGDPSGSHSERWALRVGAISHVSPTYGQVGAGEYFFDVGKSYPIRLQHQGSRYGTPDYDWYANVEPTNRPESFVVDTNVPLYIIGPYQGDGMDWAGKGFASLEARLHVARFDVDVDTRNDSGYAIPDDTPSEDRLENDGSTGKLVFATTGDVDRDGIIDSSDFGGITGAHFVPMAVRLSANVAESQPAAISLFFDYDPAVVRLWKPGCDAGAARTATDIIPARAWVNADEIGLVPGRDRTVYVEALKGVRTGTVSLSTSVRVESPRWNGTLTDTVHLLPVEVDLRVYAETGPGPQAVREPLPHEIEDGTGAVIWRNSDFSRELNHPDARLNEPGVPRYVPDYSDLTAVDPEYASQFTQAKAVFTAMMAEAFSFRFDVSDPSTVALWTRTEWTGFIPAADGWWRIPAGQEVRPARGTATEIDFWIEGLATTGYAQGSVAFRAVADASLSQARESAADAAKYTVIDVGLGVDGNRDGKIDFADSYDRQLTFWLNDDRDVEVDPRLFGMIDVGDRVGSPYETEDAAFAMKDSADAKITTKRDLEDFAAIHFLADSTLTTQTLQPATTTSAATEPRPSYRYSLKLNSAGPEIRLYRDRSESGAVDHVSNTNVAEKLVGNLAAEGNISDAETILQSLVEPDSDRRFRYFFEALGIAGRTALEYTVTITYPQHAGTGGQPRTTSRTHTLDIDLRPITDFYTRMRVPYRLPNGGDARYAAFSAGDSVMPHFPDAHPRSVAKTVATPFLHGNGTVVLVHGWNMTDGTQDRGAAADWKKAFTETAFKRLYWQGFRGNVAAFDWPTFSDSEGGPQGTTVEGVNLSYNASEFQAFRSARSLMNFLTEKQADGPVHLLAHSMGNVVAAEAFRQWTVAGNARPLVASYVAMQGAISAGAYGDDARDALDEAFGSPTSTTDYYRYWPAGQSRSGKPYMDGTGQAAGKWINMYNPYDAATSGDWFGWVANNLQKPLAGAIWRDVLFSQSYDTARRFAYRIDADGGLLRSYATATGQQLRDGEIDLSKWLMSEVQGHQLPGLAAYEIIAFMAKANAKPIGTKEVERFGTNINIQTVGLIAPYFREWSGHSFQFHFDAATTSQFWRRVVDETDMDTVRKQGTP